MGRSSGYRARKDVREEIDELRARLSQCRVSQWQKAGYIMQQITQLLGHSGGPQGGRIDPRACTYCQYFGHTKQHCPKYKRDEEMKLDKEIALNQTWQNSLGGGCCEWNAWLQWVEKLNEATIGMGCDVQDELTHDSCGLCEGCKEYAIRKDAFILSYPEPPCRYKGNDVRYTP